MEPMEKDLCPLSKLAGEPGIVVEGLATESELPDSGMATAAGLGRFLTNRSGAAIALDITVCSRG